MNANEDLINTLPGRRCTVQHHYGHTDTDKVMYIQNVYKNASYSSGLSVKVDSLPHPVDYGLICLIPEPVDELEKYKIVEDDSFA